MSDTNGNRPNATWSIGGGAPEVVTNLGRIVPLGVANDGSYLNGVSIEVRCEGGLAAQPPGRWLPAKIRGQPPVTRAPAMLTRQGLDEVEVIERMELRQSASQENM